MRTKAEEIMYVFGQASCAASPWTYRDSNGDGTGEVVESAELPEKYGEGVKDYLALGEKDAHVLSVGEPDPECNFINYYLDGFLISESKVRRWIVAWAEIRRKR